MKKYSVISLVFLMFVFISSDLLAQKEKKSPEATVKGKTNGADIIINYHQPSAKGRKVMGDLVPYGEVWRTGANNATTIEVTNDIKVEGQTLKKGKYSLFTIPGEEEWVVIFNKTANQWGAFNYDEEQDELRVKVKPEKSDKFIEAFTIAMQDEDVVLEWENTRVKFKVTD